jgi:hypothetical protein
MSCFLLSIFGVALAVFFYVLGVAVVRELIKQQAQFDRVVKK